MSQKTDLKSDAATERDKSSLPHKAWQHNDSLSPGWTRMAHTVELRQPNSRFHAEEHFPPPSQPSLFPLSFSTILHSPRLLSFLPATFQPYNNPLFALRNSSVFSAVTLGWRMSKIEWNGIGEVWAGGEAAGARGLERFLESDRGCLGSPGNAALVCVAPRG